MFVLGTVLFLVQLWTGLGLDHQVSFVRAHRELIQSEPLADRVPTLRAIHSPDLGQPYSHSFFYMSFPFSSDLHFQLALRRPEPSGRPT